MLCSTYGRKTARLIPFIIGILAGYAVAAIFTGIGRATGCEALLVTDFSAFESLVENGVGLKTFLQIPDFTFFTAIKGTGELTGAYRCV